MVNSETTFELLSARYGVAFAQQIADQLENLEKREINLFDIMAINDVVGELKQEIKDLFKSYRASQNISTHQEQVMVQVYANHRAFFIRRQILDLWKLYQMARSDSRELRKEYMCRLDLNSYQQSLPTKSDYQAAA